MDTRLWGGPLALLKDEYGNVRQQTPSSGVPSPGADNYSPSSSDTEDLASYSNRRPGLAEPLSTIPRKLGRDGSVGSLCSFDNKHSLVDMASWLLGSCHRHSSLDFVRTLEPSKSLLFCFFSHCRFPTSWLEREGKQQQACQPLTKPGWPLL
jgi:hypothetical protein